MKSSDFGTVYRTGASGAKGPLVMYVRDNGTDETRLGVSVSRKRGNSVKRHRFTRRIREIYRHSLSQTAGGKDIIVVARGDIETSYHALEECYLTLLRRHRIWTGT